MISCIIGIIKLDKSLFFDSFSISSYYFNKVKPDTIFSLATVITPGYSFLRWYVNNELITKDLSFTFHMPSEDICIVTLFEKNYVLSYESNVEDSILCNQSNSSDVQPGTAITLEAKNLAGYQFLGWYQEDE